MRDKYYGKYRGVVKSNEDPNHRGRLQVEVEDVFGKGRTSGWTLPASPYAGKMTGLFSVPPVGTNVWVEFEAGDPEYPVWTGCFWPDGEAPADQGSPDIKIWKTDQCMIKLDDSSGARGITIEVGGRMRIVLNDNGIELDNGNGAVIKLSGKTVSINGDALEVT